MAKLAFPDLPPGTPLYRLMAELHMLHARAGHPSLTEIVARQDRDRHKNDHLTRDKVHRLFSKTGEVPSLPLLYEVVRILATIAPRADVEEAQDRFDRMWVVAERYDTLGLNLQAQRAEDDSELEGSPGIEAWGDRHE